MAKASRHTIQPAQSTPADEHDRWLALGYIKFATSPIGESGSSDMRNDRKKSKNASKTTLGVKT